MRNRIMWLWGTLGINVAACRTTLRNHSYNVLDCALYIICMNNIIWGVSRHESVSLVGLCSCSGPWRASPEQSVPQGWCSKLWGKACLLDFSVYSFLDAAIFARACLSPLLYCQVSCSVNLLWKIGQEKRFSSGFGPFLNYLHIFF